MEIALGIVVAAVIIFVVINGNKGWQAENEVDHSKGIPTKDDLEQADKKKVMRKATRK